MSIDGEREKDGMAVGRGARGAAWTTVLGLLVTLAGCEVDPDRIPPDGLEILGRGIIGGTAVSDEDWPAVGAYVMSNGLCTATLVTEDIVLTAGHCVPAEHGLGSNMYFYNGNDIWSWNYSHVYEIAEYQRHPSFNSGTLYHDLALLFLAEPVTDFDPIPVNTATMDQSWVGDWFHYVGYGNRYRYDGNTSGVKYETEIQLYQLYGTWQYIHYTAGTNTCAGDSGGPSLVSIDGHWYVAGVNSAVGANSGDMCSGTGAVGFEARVDTERSFLEDYFDPYETPYGDDDDDDTAGDDDMTPAESLPPPQVDEETYDVPEGCSCTAARATSPPGLVWIVSGLILAALVRRRR